MTGGLTPEGLWARYEHLKGRPVRDPERVRAIRQIEHIRSRRRAANPELAESARQLLRALGVQPYGVRYPLLRELGLLDELERTGLSEQLLYAAQAILRSSGRRRLDDVTIADVRAHLARGPQSHRAGRTHPQNNRVVLSLVFRSYFRGPVDGDGAPRRTPPEDPRDPASRAALGLAELPVLDRVAIPTRMAADIERLRSHLADSDRTFAGVERIVTPAQIIARALVRQEGLTNCGLIEALDDPERQRRVVLHWGRPRPTPITVATMLHLFDTLEALWTLDHGQDQARTRARELQSQFHRDGRLTGPWIKVQVRNSKQVTAPSAEEIARLEDRLDGEIAATAKRRSSAGAHAVALRNRALYLCAAHGMRLSSISSMLANNIGLLSTNGMYVVNDVHIKRVRRNHETFLAEEQRGQYTIGSWILNVEILDAVAMYLRATGRDLDAWMEHRDRSALRWVEVREGQKVFGNYPEPVTRIVAPLWLSANGKGPLTGGAVSSVFTMLVRQFMGRERGSCHIFRHLAAVRFIREHTLDQLSEAEALLHMSKAMLLRYATREPSGLADMVGTHADRLAGRLRPYTDLPTDAQVVSAPTPAPRPLPKRTRLRPAQGAVGLDLSKYR